MSTAYCKSHTDAYRKCLKDCRDAGRSKTSSKTCKPLAVRLDSCRQEWSRKNNNNPHASKPPIEEESDAKSKFDGTRVLPHPNCRPLSCDVQKCIQWKRGDQTQCKTEISKLKKCMERHKGEIAKPTEGDKVWTT